MSPNLLNKYVWLVEAIDNAKKQTKNAINQLLCLFLQHQ